ncbi:P-loop containing nucleoside triphosphate hydrolase protein [Crepidotus variabilis]|uniref:P-loop containing nucleoside triphosphate hydrolase protein n=1 Tax=Crepidotus variabilis TaxID=179855 RepID=A0A9P6E651_9AGAR|nr:P-loop containing nucleoside triphosphate hydrolase protein [Crepidotus variabilis]
MESFLDPTLCISGYSYRKIWLIDSKTVTLDIIDAPSEEYYMAVREQFVKGADGILLVYSVTNRTSFGEVMNLYNLIRRVKEPSEESIQVVLAANECEQDGEHAGERVVSAIEGQNLAKNIECPIYEISTKGRQNLEEPFHELVRMIRRYKLRSEVLDGRADSLEDSSKNTQGSRCIVS